MWYSAAGNFHFFSIKENKHPGMQIKSVRIFAKIEYQLHQSNIIIMVITKRNYFSKDLLCFFNVFLVNVIDFQLII